MAFTEDQINNLMDLLKIPTEKRNFKELQERIQKLIEENAYYRYKYDETFEKILNTAGLQDIAEKIFGYLNVKDLENCQEINQSSKKILDNPMFWLRKFRGLSKENQDDWTKVIQSMKISIQSMKT